MKKLIFLFSLVIIIFVVYIKIGSAHLLQDGYYLNKYGLSKGHFHYIITENIMGIQGSKKGYIYGWVNDKSHGSKDFIVNTHTGELKWFSKFEEMSAYCKELGIPNSNMEIETNIWSLIDNTNSYESL